MNGQVHKTKHLRTIKYSRLSTLDGWRMVSEVEMYSCWEEVVVAHKSNVKVPHVIDTKNCIILKKKSRIDVCPR